MSRVGWVDKVDAELRAELTAIGQTNAQISLEPHKVAFDKLLKEFKHMKPILVKIKSAYDKALSEAQLEACEVGPLRSLVATVAEDCERKILQIRQAEKEEFKKLKEENVSLYKEIETRKHKELDLETQVKRLGDEVGELYAKYREEKTARRLLISDLNDQKIMTDQNVEVNDSVDPVHMKLALEQTRKDLKLAQQTITKMEIDYAEVVPKITHDQIVEKFELCEVERTSATKNLTQLESEYKILKETYDHVEKERAEAVKVSEDLGRSGTPRPEWEAVSKEVTSEDYIDTEKSTKEKVLQLTNDLIEAKIAGGPNYISIPNPLPDDHPTYLTTQKESVRNRKLTPEETASLIKELWKSKMKLAEDDSQNPPLWSEFLPVELEKRFNEAKDEYLYSLHYSLEKYKESHPHFINC